MCVFDPSSLTLCSPLVPITVTYSPIATPATALCHPGLPPPPQLPPTHHHQFHHHITTTTLQAHPHPSLTPLPTNTSAVTPAATATPTTINSTSHHHQTTTTIIPLSLQPPVPPPPPVLTTLIPPSSTTTGYYIQPPPPPPPPALTAATTLTSSPASSPINVCPPLVKPSPWNQSYGMEHVWMAHFTSLFKSYPHQWCLLPVEQRPLGGNFTTFVDSAKVRFCCEECGHGWTSMKGRVAFWFDLTNYTGFPQGLVAFKLFGQQCQKCKSEMYEAPMWYPEEVFKVLVNLFNRVGQNYYGFYYPPLEKTRRAGKPRTPHNSQLCQACKDGVCTNRK